MTLSASWKIPRLNAVLARSSERDAQDVTWRQDVLAVLQDIGKWEEIASRVSGEKITCKIKNNGLMLKIALKILFVSEQIFQ